ncbi:MAG TPA: hypothetical protein VGK19_02605 [Capsulimonadaceae bacterium]
MANEIVYFNEVGASLYAVIVNNAAEAWTGSGFEAPTAEDWGSYAVAVTQQADTGIYAGSFPTGIAAGTYTVAVYQSADGTPDVSDTAVASGVIRWTGSSETAGGNVVFGYM